MLFGLALAVIMLYAAVVALACTGWLIGSPARGKFNGPFTVIVPFRNEEEHLQRLLQSFAAQNEPLKVILVDDHSTDGSRQVIGNFMQANKTLLDITLLTSEGEGKKAASATGLKAVITPYVFFTDADCEWPAAFLHTASGFGSLADFYYGPVVYGRNGERTNAIYFLDQLALNGMALGLGKAGIHTYCSGANMGGRPAALQAAVPVLQRSVNLSGDDVTYLQQSAMKKQKIWPLTEPGLMVRTAAPASLGVFLGQRLRWGQKARDYKGLALPALSALVWVACCITLIVLICCLSGILSFGWGAIPLIKLCIDLLFLFLVALRLSVSLYLWAFLPAWLLNLIYIPAIGLLGMFTNMTWKGRKVKRNVPGIRDSGT